MSEEKLSILLRDRYEKAKRNDATLQIHLFGIEYANEIRKSNYPVTKIVERAGIGKGYASELSKGMKLSEYVRIKKTKKDK